MKKKLIVLLLSLISIMFSICFAGCKNPSRDKLLNYYENDDNYQTVYCKFKEVKELNKSRLTFLAYIDKERAVADYGPYVGSCFDGKKSIIIKSYEVLSANGFLGYIENNLDAEVQIILSSKAWHNGWRMPVVGVSIGETVYLDYETGKAHLLEWIEQYYD